MARGWESKDIESQQELRLEEHRMRAAAMPSPEAREKTRKRESLEMTRSRILSDLERAQHPRHRAQLSLALEHIEADIATLDAG